jgi:hypothetical protein
MSFITLVAAKLEIFYLLYVIEMENHILTMELSGRVSHSSSGDKRVPWLRKSSMVWIWQHDKRTDDYKIILNLCKKIDEK